jgi:tetratricopeptide (TPR) repeat protein
MSVDQALMKARSYSNKNKVIEAKKLYNVILKTFPKNTRALQGLAALSKPELCNTSQNPPQEEISELVSFFEQGQILAVIKQAQALIERYPNAFIVWNILGASIAKTGMLDKAIEAYKKSISLKPDFADPYYNLGNVLQEQGKLNQAIFAYNKALLLKPNYVKAYNNMGLVLQAQGKFDEAIVAYNKAISLSPDPTEAYINLGITLKHQGKLDEAIEALNKAISLKPNYAETYNNLGTVYEDQNMLDEASDAYKKAISLKPDYAEAYSNMGATLLEQGKLDESIEAYNKAISLKPDYAQAHCSLSFRLLNSDKLKEGLDENEWRWKTKKFLSQQRYFSQPLWDGKQSLNGKKILLWSEQGIGDTLNWSSCLTLVASQAERCILECQEKLVPLLKRSFPNIEVKPEDKSLDSQSNDFDFHLPMGSLYKHFIREILQNPKPEAYLVPDPVRVNFWKERLRSLGKGPYIGVCWKSSVVSAYRHKHYPPISEWSPVFAIPDVTFINLQYNDFEDDLVKVKDELGVTVHNFEDLDQYNNVDDVVALCAALDIAVTTKVTPMIFTSGVGTPTKIVNWRQSIWNNVLTNPVSSSVDMFEKNTWEPWENIFNLIAEDISKQKYSFNYSEAKL